MEFYISGSVHGETGLLSIIGRCGSEPIRPGMEFHAIMKEKPREYPNGLESPRDVDKCKSVHIKVQDVEVYGRNVEVLPANTTGVLRCVGRSSDLVEGGWILTDQCATANS